MGELALRTRFCWCVLPGLGGWLALVSSARGGRLNVGTSRPLRRYVRVTRQAWRAWFLVIAWSVLTTLLLQLDVLGLPALRIANINAWIIALYLPLALAAGGLVAWLTGLLLPWRWAGPATGTLALTVAVAGAFGMRDVVNPATVLATRGTGQQLPGFAPTHRQMRSSSPLRWRWQAPPLPARMAASGSVS